VSQRGPPIYAVVRYLVMSLVWLNCMIRAYGMASGRWHRDLLYADVPLPPNQCRLARVVVVPTLAQA
jgi:hypothetical protein